MYGSKFSLNDIACLYIYKDHKLVGLLAVNIICASKEKKAETMYVYTYVLVKMKKRRKLAHVSCSRTEPMYLVTQPRHALLGNVQKLAIEHVRDTRGSLAAQTVH